MHRNHSTHPLVLLLLVLTAGLSQAHTRSQSYSSWILQGQTLTGTFRTTAVEATRLNAIDPIRTDLAAALARHLATRVRVYGEAACKMSAPPRPLHATPQTLSVEMQFHCPEPVQQLQVKIDAFFEVAAGHLHFARVRVDDELTERVLSDGERSFSINTDDQPPGWWETVLRYGPLGVTHILSGADHLVFLLGLVLLCGIGRQLFIAVTGFTLGHSLTLSLATLDILRPQIPAIEALIGLSIALIGLECAVRKGDRGLAGVAAIVLLALAVTSLIAPAALSVFNLFGLALFAFCYLRLADTTNNRLTLTVTALFGLIHGFGFAAVLLEVGLPTTQLLPALISFNLGVEVGQLLFVAALLGLIIIARLLPANFPATTMRAAAVAGLCGLGLFWFFARTFLLAI